MEEESLKILNKESKMKVKHKPRTILKSWENMIKSTEHLAEPEKMNHIKEKYCELHNTLYQTSQKCKDIEQLNAVLCKEKEHLQLEHNKTVLSKGKLENLCRELQKQNKEIRDESISKIKSEEKQRKELALKFTSKLTEISSLMDKNEEKNTLLKCENEKLTKKLKDLLVDFKKAEENFKKMMEQMEHQKQQTQTIISKMEYEAKADKQVWEKEEQFLKTKIEKSEASNKLLRENIEALQKQLEIYKKQYADFESSMRKNNETFKNFTSEMKKMKYNVVTVEHQANLYKRKFEDSEHALAQMRNYVKQEKQASKMKEKKIQTLQKLCRQLQVDRAEHLKLLHEHGVKMKSDLCSGDAKEQFDNQTNLNTDPKLHTMNIVGSETKEEGQTEKQNANQSEIKVESGDTNMKKTQDTKCNTSTHDVNCDVL